MYRTLQIKLDRSNALIQTARIWNAACQDVIDYGFAAHDYNKTRLNRATYKDLREKYPTLPSALLQTARDQASDMLKRLRFKTKPFKKPLGAVRFDIRTMKVFLESGYCKLTTAFGRLRYDFQLPEYYKRYVGWKVTNAQLKITKNACYLNVQVEQPDPEPITGDRRLGVDLGINNIAVCSDNTFWESGHVKAVKGKCQYLRSKLQSKGTRSAKRKLQKLSGRERRFQKDVNHQIANWIVSKPYDIIALEDLTNIRNGNKNKKLGKWSFAELRSFVEYKAMAIGKNVITIDPRYTSQTCSRCGYQHKNNRIGRIFKCKSCGFQIDADLNASRNIATFSRSDRSRLQSTSQ
ncbi:MAG: transposase [Euryarchaeota archaeon]|jgi:IS605 OrfB family transposase|uniref:Transposase n=1 Tax=Methanothrix harundinacea TaxID=301375 RepID=A0A101IGU1_9EURY|nr:MAG: Transposase [Methanothrix harundinacea]KUK94971.1 MAG: Transposase [Methanothrix harundinacea]MCP1393514.1 transposase [Methanothrix harundinacea]MDI9399159.1 transposase [Euryarchaeota archaeon]